MILNHLDLHVSNVQAAAAFFERTFGFRHGSSRTSPALVILHGDGGFVLVLQRRHAQAPYPEGFHFGFLVDTVEKVHSTRERVLREHVEPGPVHSDARGTRFYFDYDGLLVEVGHRPST